jgi:hypothetical protein
VHQFQIYSISCAPFVARLGVREGAGCLEKLMVFSAAA